MVLFCFFFLNYLHLFVMPREIRTEDLVRATLGPLSQPRSSQDQLHYPRFRWVKNIQPAAASSITFLWVLGVQLLVRKDQPYCREHAGLTFLVSTCATHSVFGLFLLASFGMLPYFLFISIIRVLHHSFASTRLCRGYRPGVMFTRKVMLKLFLAPLFDRIFHNSCDCTSPESGTAGEDTGVRQVERVPNSTLFKSTYSYITLHAFGNGREKFPFW